MLYPQRETVAFRVFEEFATLCRSGIGSGLGLGDPRVTPGVTQASRMGRLVEASLFATKTRNDGVGSSMIAIIAEIAKIENQNLLSHKGLEGTQSEKQCSQSRYPRD